MKIIIIDDSEVKCGDVRDICDSIGGIDLIVSDNYIDGKRMLESTTFDLLIIDLNLPLRRGDDPKPSLGSSLLVEIERAGSNIMPPHFIIGLTEDEETAKKNAHAFSNDFWTIVVYQFNSTDWKTSLHKAILSRKARTVPYGAAGPTISIGQPSVAKNTKWINPIQFTREATQKVPALKYAMAVVAIGVFYFLLQPFIGHPRVIVACVFIGIILMIAVVVFSKVAVAKKQHFDWPVRLLIWFVALALMSVFTLLGSSVFFNKPLKLSAMFNFDVAPTETKVDDGHPPSSLIP